MINNTPSSDVKSNVYINLLELIACGWRYKYFFISVWLVISFLIYLSMFSYKAQMVIRVSPEITNANKQLNILFPFGVGDNRFCRVGDYSIDTSDTSKISEWGSILHWEKLIPNFVTLMPDYPTIMARLRDGKRFMDYVAANPPDYPVDTDAILRTMYLTSQFDRMVQPVAFQRPEFRSTDPKGQYLSGILITTYGRNPAFVSGNLRLFSGYVYDTVIRTTLASFIGESLNIVRTALLQIESQSKSLSFEKKIGEDIYGMYNNLIVLGNTNKTTCEPQNIDNMAYAQRYCHAPDRNENFLKIVEFNVLKNAELSVVDKNYEICKLLLNYYHELDELFKSYPSKKFLLDRFEGQGNALSLALSTLDKENIFAIQMSNNLLSSNFHRYFDTVIEQPQGWRNTSVIAARSAKILIPFCIAGGFFCTLFLLFVCYTILVFKKTSTC